MKTSIFTHAAAKDLDALPPEGRMQVEAGLIRHATNAEGDVKQLGSREGYRLRIGRYRVLFDEDRSTILAIYTGQRTTTTCRRR